MSKVFAVVLNYNSFEDTKKCVSFLKKQEQADLEICVVDNCSTDHTSAELEEYARQNQILFIANHENKGFSAGNNVGLRKAAELGYEYALIINPDVELRDNNYVRDAILQMDKDKSIAVLGTDVINKKEQHQNPMRELFFFEEVCWPYISIRNRVKKTLPYVKNYKKSGYCKKLSGCCFFIRLSFAKEIDYLDENVFMFSEEPLLAAAVKEKDYKEYYMASQHAYHMHKDKPKEGNKDNIHRFFESRKYYLKKTNKYGKLGNKIAFFALSKQEKHLVK